LELERELEIERRKVHELQDASREREKEYQKLKAQHDQMKRKALLVPDTARATMQVASGLNPIGRTQPDNAMVTRQTSGSVDVGAVLGGMEASGIQRTPLVNRTVPTSFGGQAHTWSNSRARIPSSSGPQRLNPCDRSFKENSVSDRSESVNEVENMLLSHQIRTSSAGAQGGWGSSGKLQRRPLLRHCIWPIA
ncbi:hypothetical protein ID866_4706, partial [Astraeus odoratus]